MKRTNKILWVSLRIASHIGFVGLFMLVFSMPLREAFGDERPTHPGIGPNTIELLSYEDSDYRFHIIPLDEAPPSGFEQPDFDETAFNIGSAAFGSGGDCPLQERVQTPWPVNSQLLVRRVVDIPAGATDIRIMVSIDNDIIGVFFNGKLIDTNIVHDQCPILDEFRFDVPQELVQAGSNLVVFHVLDRGVESFFDTRMLAERPKTRMLEEGIVQAKINDQAFTAKVRGRWDLLDQGGYGRAYYSRFLESS
jgi:hypothetical protein